MPKFIDTRGNQFLAIGICDRCKRKFPLEKLLIDPNYPALRVCIEDRDQFDPWRLPARAPEDITVRYPRPDEPLA